MLSAASYEETQCSFNEIGRELGNRDHSSVLRGYDKIALEINTRPQLRHDVIEIREGLTTRGKG